MTINDLQYYMDIIDTGSISEAARKHAVSQQSVSVHLKKLEEHYGVPLLIREHPMSPTEAGQRLYKIAKKIERMLEEFEASLTVEQSSLTIGLVNSDPPAFIAAVIAELNAGRSKLDVRLCMNCHAKGREKAADIYIGPVPDREHYDVVPLLEDKLVVAVSEELLTGCFGQNAGDVKQKLLSSGSLSLLKGVTFSVCYDIPELEQHLQEIDIMVRSNDYGILNSLCLQGKCASFIWLDSARRTFAANKNILIFPVAECDAARTLCIYYDKGHILSPVSRQFIQAAKRYFSREDDFSDALSDGENIGS